MDIDIIRRLSSSSALMGMLPNNPGYNGSILLIDDIEAERISKDINDAIAEIESLRNQLSTNTWIKVNDKLPDEGQEIIGLNDENDVWNEIFDLSEPLGSMKYWIPVPKAPTHKER